MLGWVQYCSNTKADSRLNFCLQKFSVTSRQLEPQILKVFEEGYGEKTFSKKFLPKSTAQTNLRIPHIPFSKPRIYKIARVKACAVGAEDGGRAEEQEDAHRRKAGLFCDLRRRDFPFADKKNGKE